MEIHSGFLFYKGLERSKILLSKLCAKDKSLHFASGLFPLGTNEKYDYICIVVPQNALIDLSISIC